MIAPANIAATMRGRVVLDPYAVLDASAAHAAGLRLYTLGRAPMAEKSCETERPDADPYVRTAAAARTGGAHRQRRLCGRRYRPQPCGRRIPHLALGRGELDLLASDAGTRPGALLRAGDAVVAAAAIAPCKSTAMLIDNMRMVGALVTGLAASPVEHVVNISSDAIYADEPVSLTEATPTAPTSLHGAMHIAREVALPPSFASRSPCCARP